MNTAYLTPKFRKRRPAVSPRRNWFAARQPAVQRGFRRSDVARASSQSALYSEVPAMTVAALYGRYAIPAAMIGFWGWFLAVNGQRIFDIGRAVWGWLVG